MSSTTTCEAGEVVVVEVPYSDHAGVKRRPAVVVSTEAFHGKLLDVIVCPVSSRPRYHRNPGPGDHPLTQWQAVGLRHPSTVRVSKILAIDKKIIRRTLGALTPQDLTQVKYALRKAFALEGAAPNGTTDTSSGGCPPSVPTA